MENGFLAVDDQRMARIVATLEAHYSASLVGEKIDDFTFALVAPLGAENYYVFAHGVAFSAVIPAKAGIQ
ncbi:hypothetical protein GCM10007052_32530 [Halioglobus japonicus]|nr:hypothetical protein GCM10007052_32530 [Halioglobus japonicus]